MTPGTNENEVGFVPHRFCLEEGMDFRKIFRITAYLIFLCTAATLVVAQPPRSKTIFRDAAGALISNNEFVDLRLANPHEKKDPATKVVHDDGTVEFRLTPVRQEGTVAPAFDAVTLGGKSISARELRGKVLVYNFWFIGCPGCLEEMPKLNSFVEKYKHDPNVVFIAVSRNSPAALHQFLSRERFDYQMIGNGRAVLDLFRFSGYPRNIIVGKDGRIAYWRTTVRAWEKFDSVIREELSKN
jgi:peroxiredoxin